METMNSDTLSLIFHMIDFRDRINLEAVCVKWKELLQKQSTFSDMKIVDMSDYIIDSANIIYEQEHPGFEQKTLALVERCGAYIQELSFGWKWLRINQNIMDNIADYCHRIRVLDLSGTIIDADITPLLETVGHLLEYLSLEETSWVDVQNAEKISDYYPFMKQLKHLNIRLAQGKTLNDVGRLPSKLRYANISSIYKMEAESFCNFLNAQDEMEELEACPLPIFTSGVVEKITSLQHLKKLRIGYDGIHYAKMEKLTKLAQLEHLSLVDLNFVNESILQIILTSFGKLTHLHIINCKHILNYTALKYCGNVTHLEIAGTEKLHDDDLNSISVHFKLQSIVLRNCCNISNISIINLLRRKQLNELTISKNNLITDDVCRTILETQSSLQKIGFINCPRITSSSLSILAKLNSKLEIDVQDSERIDHKAILRTELTNRHILISKNVDHG